jgi:hypothetical protein
MSVLNIHIRSLFPSSMLDTKVLSPSPSSQPYQPHHQQSPHPQKSIRSFLGNQEDSLQIKSLPSDVQHILGFEASKGRPECTSLIVQLSIIYKHGQLQAEKYLPAESPDPVCSFSTEWTTSQCQNTVSPGLTLGTEIIHSSNRR